LTGHAIFGDAKRKQELNNLFFVHDSVARWAEGEGRERERLKKELWNQSRRENSVAK
jgi:hypothetical protein